MPILQLLSIYSFCLHYIACLQDFSAGLLWPTSRQNRIVTQSCSMLHPSFRSRVTVNRRCNGDGTWGPVDDSNCTALNNAIPILFISFEVNVSLDDAQHFVNKVSLCTYLLTYVPLPTVATM